MGMGKLFALRNRTFMLVLTILMVGGGISAFNSLGQLEDPTFTIKTAIIATAYPGASPAEVEEEVTDIIAEAVQEMSQLKEVYSTSQEGYSFVYVDIDDNYTHDRLPQVWDELRRKISDIQGNLPPGAGPSSVNDDFGDVYGVFFAVTGEGYTNAQLKDYADELKKELLHCRDVAKIDLWGEQQEAIFVEFKQAQLTQLGLSPAQILQTLQNQNLVQKSGKMKIADNYVRISPTGALNTEEQIADLLIGNATGMLRLRDVAHVHRGYIEPPRNYMRYNGNEAVGLGISTQTGGNVVLMGEAIQAKLKQLESARPDGIELNSIYYQSREVTKSVNIFLTNLLEAVLIVIALLMLFMGWRSGMLIGAVLLLTILCTFIGMAVMSIDLQKVSLGALILALGMLVDNAIVVVDGALIRMERGETKETAATQAVYSTRWPLFGATVVAILAFTAIGFSPGNVGEFCRSMFYVLALSLSISWILAISITPLFCVWFLRIGKKKEPRQDPYSGPIYRTYRTLLHFSVRFKWLVMGATILGLVVAMFGFQYVNKSFFPDSTQRYFYVNFWNPQGTHIDKTATDIEHLNNYVSKLEGVIGTTAFIGEGGMRFVLSYDYQTPNSAYGQLLVEVEDYQQIDRLIVQVENYMADHFPVAEPFTSRVPNGPAITFKIEARLHGSNATVLRELAGQVSEVLSQSGNASDLRIDWRQPVSVIRPEFSQTQARYAGVSRNDLAAAIQWKFNGMTGGLFREGNKLIPIVFRSPEKERMDSDSLAGLQVWSPLHNGYVPMRQVVSKIVTTQEDALIKRRDRLKTMTVQCNPTAGLADAYLLSIRDKVEAIKLPPGYSLDWGGEYKSSVDAQAGLKKIFPICMLAMFVVVVWMFNSFRRPLIIFATVPLALIGVVAGLLITGLPFGFMAILGFLGLSGMLIKNAIVLIDQIELDIATGSERYKAVLDSSVSRVRPVVMASGTTILGMIPLLTDPFYASMAATIMSGLFVATFLTLVFVPVTYSLIYRIKAEKHHV